MNPKTCKCLFILPLILFADYLILVLFGATSCFVGGVGAHYCSVYAIVAILLSVASIVLFTWYAIKKTKKT
ncbi:MAG: hypothetical protein K9H16_10105 [Bacteroidales bacterium]|nr:hypothetical protein [Bacteroidales bacterium]